MLPRNKQTLGREVVSYHTYQVLQSTSLTISRLSVYFALGQRPAGKPPTLCVRNCCINSSVRVPSSVRPTLQRENARCFAHVLLLILPVLAAVFRPPLPQYSQHSQCERRSVLPSILGSLLYTGSICAILVHEYTHTYIPVGGWGAIMPVDGRRYSRPLTASSQGRQGQPSWTAVRDSCQENPHTKNGIPRLNGP